MRTEGPDVLTLHNLDHLRVSSSQISDVVPYDVVVPYHVPDGRPGGLLELSHMYKEAGMRSFSISPARKSLRVGRSCPGSLE